MKFTGNDTQSIQSKIKKIKIQTKRIMRNTLSGDYLSAFKGSGLEFEQIREYIPGDDIRTIDWNSSAKMDKIMVKQFVQERDRTVIIAIDVSKSTFFSSSNELKKQAIESLAGTLALIASTNKDNVGVLLFSDIIEQWVAPSKGNVHLGTILKTIFSFNPQGSKTNLAQALQFLIALKKRNAVVFMISDWIDTTSSYTKFLKIAGCEYDFVGVRMLDTVEKQFPDIGLIDLEDSEEGVLLTINATKSMNQGSIHYVLHSRFIEQKKLFEKYSIDLLDLAVEKSFLTPLINFFHKRIRRQV